MLVGNVELERYVESHDRQCLHTVLQFLEISGWSPEAEEWLRNYLRDAEVEVEVVPVTTDTVVDMPFLGEDCPRCGKIMRGARVPHCETRHTGRMFYKECSECAYYSETFIIDDVETEIEGG